MNANWHGMAWQKTKGDGNEAVGHLGSSFTTSVIAPNLVVILNRLKEVGGIILFHVGLNSYTPLTTTVLHSPFSIQTGYACYSHSNICI